MTMQEVLSSLKLPDWLKSNDLRIFYLKMSPDCFRMTAAGRLQSSSPHFMTWGIMSNGLCLTANISESRNPDEGCSLSDILIPDAPEKYFLSSEHDGKALIQLVGGPQGHRVYDPEGVACTQTAGRRRPRRENRVVPRTRMIRKTTLRRPVQPASKTDRTCPVRHGPLWADHTCPTTGESDPASCSSRRQRKKATRRRHQAIPWIWAMRAAIPAAGA